MDRRGACEAWLVSAAKGRTPPFAKPTIYYDRLLRIAAVHCVVFAKQQSPPAQARDWVLTLGRAANAR